MDYLSQPFVPSLIFLLSQFTAFGNYVIKYFISVTTNILFAIIIIISIYLSDFLLGQIWHTHFTVRNDVRIKYHVWPLLKCLVRSFHFGAPLIPRNKYSTAKQVFLGGKPPGAKLICLIPIHLGLFWSQVSIIFIMSRSSHSSCSSCCYCLFLFCWFLF